MKIFTYRLIYLLLFIFQSVWQLKAQAPVLTFTAVINTGLNAPLDVVNAGDGSNRLFIVQQGGTVKIFKNGSLLPNNFLNIADTITSGDERGLLSLAFHPNYASNRYFFLYYNNEANSSIIIARMQTKADNPDEAIAGSLVVLLTIPKPFSNHNGGKLLFGPDGNLYFGTGDGGSGGDPNNFSQNGNSLLGKMIRINVDNFDTAPYYSIPPDNPYVNDDAVKDEIFCRGLRNPFRWSFDKLNNDVWIADVGQGLWEEVNREPFSTTALNYGWRCYEGNAAYNISGCAAAENYVKPIFAYPHNPATGGFVVTGGYVYRGTVYPALYGYYICVDFATANAWLIAASDTGYTAAIQPGVPGSIAGFGEGEDGELYAITLTGKLYSVGTSTVLPVLLQSFTAKPYLGFNELNWQLATGAAVTTTQVLYSFDGVSFQPAGNAVQNGQQTFVHVIDGYSTIYYRLKFTLANGQVIYSTIIKVDKGTNSVLKLYPTVVNNNLLKLETTTPVQQLVIFAMDGKKVFEKKFANFLGNTVIYLPALNNGMYIAQLYVNGKPLNYKIFVGR